MGDYPNLVHLDIGTLTAGAGGDPWKIDDTLQAGEPGEIAQLAETFYRAGACTTEADTKFVAAKQQFEASWNRENGAHPINDSAELQSMTRSMAAQPAQLAMVAADLETVAAILAEAQRLASIDLSICDSALQSIDAAIGQGLANHQDCSALQQDAIEFTKVALTQITGLRDEYSEGLSNALTSLRVDGYNTSHLAGLDGDGQQTAAEHEKSAVDKYGADQRAADQALVDSPGPMTQEKAEAAGRLRDFAVATDPNADSTARHLAGERLDDFNMANVVGPLPVDPILGGDARDRARARLEAQRLFANAPEGYRMTPDQLTWMMDSSEQMSRTVITQQAVKTLVGEGISEEGAEKLVGNIANYGGLAADAGERYGESVPAGRHAKPAGLAEVLGLSAEDAEAFGKVAGRVSKAGTAVELALAGKDWLEGGENRNEELGGALGDVAGTSGGAYVAGLAAATFLAPEFTIPAVIIGGLIGGGLGEGVGGDIGSAFDPQPVAGGKSW